MTLQNDETPTTSRNLTKLASSNEPKKKKQILKLAENMQEFAESEDAILGSDDEDKDPAIVAANVDTIGTNTVLSAIVAANTTIPDAAADVAEEIVDLIFQDFEKKKSDR
ncbi:hypothetical protein V6N13_014291 [Hibiscus sabdariffa]